MTKMQPQPSESRPPRRRGRPPKTPEQRRQEQERRIPPSFAGRLKFRPGDPHALDVQIKEARNYRALIREQIGVCPWLEQKVGIAA
jgi:hypothetical protein